MKHIILLSFATLLFASCSENEQSTLTSISKEKNIDRSLLLDISEFNLDTTALRENEQVKILCASESLFPTDIVDYYIHTVAVSLETGDTVNLLATGVLNVKKDDPYGEFLSPNSDMGKLLQNINTIEDGVNVNDLSSSNFDKVFSDPRFINIETAHFPSIIGMISEVKKSIE